MKVISESKMNFGQFAEENLFHIEKSKIYKDLGSGIKTVEFILKYDENSTMIERVCSMSASSCCVMLLVARHTCILLSSDYLLFATPPPLDLSRTVSFICCHRYLASSTAWKESVVSGLEKLTIVC